MLETSEKVLLVPFRLVLFLITDNSVNKQWICKLVRNTSQSMNNKIMVPSLCIEHCLINSFIIYNILYHNWLWNITHTNINITSRYSQQVIFFICILVLLHWWIESKIVPNMNPSWTHCFLSEFFALVGTHLPSTAHKHTVSDVSFLYLWSLCAKPPL